MAGMSDYLEDALLDHTLGVAALAAPASVYLALFTSDPTDADSGTEVSTGGYARLVLTFAAASGGTAANTVLRAFTASGAAFGTVTHFGIYDAVTGGNLLYHAALDTARTVNDGDTLTFGVGQVTVTLD